MSGEATDPEDAFWFFRPRAFAERLLVPEEAFVHAIGGQIAEEVYTAVWYLVMDGQTITHNDAAHSSVAPGPYSSARRRCCPIRRSVSRR